MSVHGRKTDLISSRCECTQMTPSRHSGLNAHPARLVLSSVTTAASSPPPGGTISDFDWDNVGDNLDDEGKEAEIAAAGPRYCAVASLR